MTDGLILLLSQKHCELDNAEEVFQFPHEKSSHPYESWWNPLALESVIASYPVILLHLQQVKLLTFHIIFQAFLLIYIILMFLFISAL